MTAVTRRFVNVAIKCVYIYKYGEEIEREETQQQKVDQSAWSLVLFSFSSFENRRRGRGYNGLLL